MANIHFRYINYLRRTRKPHFIISSCPWLTCLLLQVMDRDNVSGRIGVSTLVIQGASRGCPCDSVASCLHCHLIDRKGIPHVKTCCNSFFGDQTKPLLCPEIFYPQYVNQKNRQSSQVKHKNIAHQSINQKQFVQRLLQILDGGA